MKKVMFLVLLATCANPPARVHVYDIDSNRQQIRNVVSMIDGLDDHATDAALQYLHKQVKDQFAADEKLIYAQNKQLSVCSMRLDDAIGQIETCTDEKAKIAKQLKDSTGWLASFGLRVQWFVYGALAMLAGVIVAWLSGWLIKFAGALRS